MWHKFAHRTSPEQRLRREADELRARAKHMPPGVARDAILRRARQAETASQKNDWLNAAELRPPT